MNAAAEKIIRQELQRLGAPSRFLVCPAREWRRRRAGIGCARGSMQEAALASAGQPAREIFNAEVRSVVDLALQNRVTAIHPKERI